MILIKNGLLIIENNLVKKDVLIGEGKILSIQDNIEGDYQTIDASKCLVMEGGCDVHVHLREPGFEHKETILSGTRSAAKGGFTSVMAMPNLRPCPSDVASLNVQLECLRKDAVVNVYPYASVSINEEDKELSDIDNLHDLVYAFSDDGRGVNNLELLENAMKKAKKYNFIIASHAEDNLYKTSPQGEYLAVRREIELAKKIGCRYHFCHLSTKESFEEIRKARKEGFTNITCEITPHHLLLNDTMIKNGNYKMNPPLRSEEDRKATVEALLDGTASMIASDHAPHSKEEKAQELSKCPNGIIGLETSFPLIYTYFVKTGLISLQKMVDIFVKKPLEIFSLPKYGMYEGSNANIIILDINNEREYKEDEIVSKGKNSPFIGYKLYGFNKATIVNGEIVYLRKD